VKAKDINWFKFGGTQTLTYPDFIKEAAKPAIDQNYSSYSPSGWVNADLKQAIAK